MTSTNAHMSALRISSACAGGQHWRCFGKRRPHGEPWSTCECTCSHPLSKSRSEKVLSRFKPVPVPDQP